MSKNLTIIDKDYIHWVEELSVRYRQSQIKAAVRVNRELLKYYWELGRDIEEMHVEERWGQSVIKNLSVDLQLKNPNSTGLSRTNIYYAKKFYLLYSQYLKIVRGRKCVTICGRFSWSCPTICGTIRRDAFFHTLGASSLFD